MGNIRERIRHEIREVLPPTIFFIVALNVLAVTKSLFLLEHGIRFTNFLGTTLLALVVAKVVVIVDKVGIVNRYPDKPLIYNTIWKTLIYIVATFVARVLETLFHAYQEVSTLAAAWQHMAENVIWPHFIAVLLWLSILFLTYVALRELTRSLGREKVIQMFFGPLKPSE